MEQKRRSLAGEAESQKTVEAQKSGKPLKIIILAAAVLLLAGGGLVFSGNIKALWDRNFGSVLADGESKYLFSLDEFTINLADEGGRRFMRIKFQLGFDDRALQRELERRQHEIRSELIILLRSKRAADLLQEGAAAELRDEILRMINGMLQSGAVKSIYYEDLLIQ